MAEQSYFDAAGIPSGHAGHDVQNFAEAISSRYGGTTILTARLTAGSNVSDTTVTTPFAAGPQTAPFQFKTPPVARSPAHTPVSSSSLPNTFTSVLPSELEPWLSTALILDLRPRSSYVTARIPSCLNLSVPSTLLKRPAFSLSKLADMLSSPGIRAAFRKWHEAESILVYDADSSSLDTPTRNLAGLLNKFRAEGYIKPIGWISGGFTAVWKDARHLVDEGPAPEESADGPDNSFTTPSLRAGHLPQSAFNMSTATNKHAPPIHSPVVGTSKGSKSSKSSGSLQQQQQTQQHFNPFYDSVRQNAELAQGITERIPLKLSARVKERIQSLPFKWLQEIAKGAETVSRSPVDSDLSSSDMSESSSDSDVNSDVAASSDSDSSPVRPRLPFPVNSPRIPPAASPQMNSSADVEKTTEALAMQFYKLELAEQRRMMGILEYHSQEAPEQNPTDPPPASSSKAIIQVSGDESNSSGSSKTVKFPFSITAGVEKGAKNRYRHVWPFEYARVKLGTPAPVFKRPEFDYNKLGERPRVPFYAASSTANSSVTSYVIPTSEASDLPSSRSSESKDSSIEASIPQKPQSPSPGSVGTTSSGDNGRSSENSGESRGSRGSGGSVPSSAYSGPSETSNPPGFDDYINASYVQPLGTRQRYIATQGPLDATFTDFWTLVWEQSVHLIVMLTQEMEGNHVKCGKYWTDGKYGPHLTLQCIASDASDGDETNDKGFFNSTPGASSSRPVQPHKSTIQRTFLLHHALHPTSPPRKIIHLQYLDWPDMNVPDNPRDVLNLVWEVRRIYKLIGEEIRAQNGKGEEEAGSSSTTVHRKHENSMEVDTSPFSPSASSTSSRQKGKHRSTSSVHSASSSPSPSRREETGPVLLHCSAGVGRTGGFIAIDSILDGIRHELRHGHRRRQKNPFERSTIARPLSQKVASSSDVVSSELGAKMPSGRSVSAGGGLSVHPPLGDNTKMDVDEDRTTAGFGRSKAGRGHMVDWARDVFSNVDDHDPEAMGPATTRENEDAAPSPEGHSSTSEQATSDQSSFDFSAATPGGSSQPTSNSLPSSDEPGILASRPEETSPPHTTLSPPAPKLLANPSTSIVQEQGGQFLFPRMSEDVPMSNSPSPMKLSGSTKKGSARASSVQFAPPPSSTDVRFTSGESSSQPGVVRRSRKGSSSPSSQYPFDYTDPRGLHGDMMDSPFTLSTMKDPVWEVIQDMRQQRMSLCQSLRQYVFVHAAIIEGALIVRDEERKRAKRRAQTKRMKTRTVPRPGPLERDVTARPIGRTSDPMMVDSSEGYNPSAQSFGESDSGTSNSASRVKRRHSPTELIPQDKRGDARLSKRPSLKKKNPSEERPGSSAFPRGASPFTEVDERF